MDVFELYRCDNNSGGTKDWGITISPDLGLVVRHCGTGKPARLLVIPVQGSKKAEKVKRIEAKRKEGYVYVGKATIKNNRFEKVTNDVVSENFSLFYRGKSMLDETFLDNIFKSASEKVDVFDYDEFNQTIKVTTPTPGLFWEYSLSSLSAQSGGKVFTGEVDKVLYGEWPLLLLMYINEQHELHFANAKGKETKLHISPSSEWFNSSEYPYMLIEEKASQLGLILSLNDFQNIGSQSSGQQNTTFWF